MTQAAACPTTTARPALPAFPPVYALIVRGDCMFPELKDGEPVIVSSLEPCRAGDTVVVHLKPEFVMAGGYEAYVKRLKFDLLGASFPWDSAGSDVVIALGLEQINPPAKLNIPYDQIAAVHKVLGQGIRAPNGAVMAHRSMIEAPQRRAA